MIKAVADKIVVEIMIVGKTRGGLILPSNTSTPQGYGRVISIGEKVDNPSVQLGAILVFHPHAGMDMVLDKNVLKVLKYDELYGILIDNDIAETLTTVVIGGKTEGEQIIRSASSIIQ